MPSFEIPDGPTTVPLNASGEGEQMVRGGNAVYGVTNKSATPLGGRLSVQVAGDAKAEWFTIDGEKERVFAAGENQTVTVAIKIPVAVSPGDYKFRLRVVSVNDPDNDHMDSPVGTVAVPAPEGAAPPPKPFPAWIIAVIVGVVILIIGIGVAVWFFTKDGGGGGGETPGKMPAFEEGVTFEQASETLKALDGTLVITQAVDEDPDSVFGQITDTDPDAGRALELGQEVVLTVARGPSIPTPKLDGMSLAEAAAVARAFDLTVKSVPAARATGVPPTQVISQVPEAGDPTHRGSEIQLVTDPGVPVPNLVGQNDIDAINLIGRSNLIPSISTVCVGATAANNRKVSAQTPSFPSQPVASASTISITVFNTSGWCIVGNYNVYEYSQRERRAISPDVLARIQKYQPE